jgi:hypothetical protein
MTARYLSEIAHSEPAAATGGQILFSTQQGGIIQRDYAAPMKAGSPPNRPLHLLSIVSSFEQPRREE